VVGRTPGILSMLYLVKIIEIYKIIVSKLISENPIIDRKFHNPYSKAL